MAFFKLGEAFQELKSATGAQDTTVAGAKLAGKALFNFGKLAFDEITKHNERTSENLLSRSDLTDEQRERLSTIHANSKEVRINTEVKDKASTIEDGIKQIDLRIHENEGILNDAEITIKRRNGIERVNTSLAKLKQWILTELDTINFGDSTMDIVNNKLEQLIRELEEKLEEQKNLELDIDELTENESQRKTIETSVSESSDLIQPDDCKQGNETLVECAKNEGMAIDLVLPLAKTSASILDEKKYSEPNLIDYLHQILVEGEAIKRVFVHPDIPLEKRANGISASSFPDALKAEKTLLLIDDSARLNGRDGLIVTDKRFSFLGSDDYIYTPSFNGQFDVQNMNVVRMGSVIKKFVYLDQQDIASIFSLINGFLKDRHQWNERMASEGNVQSQFFLSLSCYLEPEVEELWLTKAAENGHIVAQHNMGIRFLQKDAEKAFYWFSLAAKQGSELSKQRLLNECFAKFKK
ncbi:MAG: hypothetical protein U1C96_04325 [Gallionella sp.]|nr:hypothetical protein [Gallionella sp.]